MFDANSDDDRLSVVSKEFLVFAQVELGFAAESIVKYRDCYRQLEKALGDFAISSFTKSDLFRLRLYMKDRSHSESRQTQILAALKRLLLFARDECGRVLLFAPETIRMPRRPRREVKYLSQQDVARLVGCIRLTTRKGEPHLANLRLRALVEVLLGTAMRIGEALSLDRSQIDYGEHEARIIGKGNKERVVFFTERSLTWLSQYLAARADQQPALFSTLDGQHRLTRTDIWRSFARLQQLSGLDKPIRPHILRHTAATQLLLNGCPVGHIKEILGHDRLETTCRYYLGIDKAAAKQAHHKWMNYVTDT